MDQQPICIMALVWSTRGRAAARKVSSPCSPMARHTIRLSDLDSCMEVDPYPLVKYTNFLMGSTSVQLCGVGPSEDS